MLKKKKLPALFLYYNKKPFIQKWLYNFNKNNKQPLCKKFKKISLLKIPKLLLKSQKKLTKHLDFTLIEQYFTKIFFTAKHSWKYYFTNKKATNSTWQLLKKIKQQHKTARTLERRRLSRLKIFYRNFGFRKNKHRIARTLTRTKKFKKFKRYYQILQLIRHKKKLRQSYIFPVQSSRITGPSFYKIKNQLCYYWQRNYFSKNFNKKKLAILTNKFNKYKQKRLVKFTSKIELTLSSLLLRTRLLKTIGIINQFIKHGNVYVNYKKICYPAYNIKPGDTISIYVNLWNQKYHRFNDPLYAHRIMHGLYRKNTGRQSLTSREKKYSITKTSLNNINTINYMATSVNKNIIHDILPYSAQDRLKKTNNINNKSIANWKLSFICKNIPNYFIQQNKYIDYINNNLA